MRWTSRAAGQCDQHLARRSAALAQSMPDGRKASPFKPRGYLACEGGKACHKAEWFGIGVLVARPWRRQALMASREDLSPWSQSGTRGESDKVPGQR